VNHPPVIVHPHPGQPNHGMPKPPHQDHPIDPSHHGDNRAVHPPERDHNGQPVTQRPNRDAHGRDIPPGRDHMGRIDRKDFRDNIHHEQDRWNARDHDYHWHDWNGWRVCHHYDEFGFHWWGFYVGEVYFWTRYYNDNYWWFDPYWHRWVYMRDGQWWWTGPDGWVYVYNGGVYYHYQPADGGVIMTPDPTPPVDVPPGDPAPANQTSVYSLDGTRSIQITGEGKDAYLYDLTAADPQSPEAQGKYLASGVKSAAFVNEGDAVKSIVLTAVDETGAETTLTFDRDGAATGGSAAPGSAAQAVQPESDGSMIETLQRKTEGSETFKALKSGFGW
jgi:hypothetical protein